MKRIAIVLLLALLLTGCAAQNMNVSCTSALSEDTIMETVSLSDGYLSFALAAHGADSMIDFSEPKHTETVTYTYEDVVAFLQCDLIQVFREAGVPERCIPTEEDFFTEGKKLLEDESFGPSYHLTKGTIFGGEGFSITVPDAEYSWISRKVWLGANLEGEFVGMPIEPEMWEMEPNSQVGEIPVYINYCRLRAPALGGYETDEFFACFDIAGYTYGLYTRDCTQEEFVTMLLAIINHYGAYPSEEAA